LTVLPWIVVLVCAALQAFFAASELSIASANGVRLEEAAKRGDAAAERVIWFRNHPERLFGTTLVGANLSLVVGATVAALTLATTLGDAAGTWLALALLAPLLLVGAEVVPRSLAQARATTLAPRLARGLYAAYLVLIAPVSVVRGYARLLSDLLGIERGKRVPVSREELMLMLDADEPGGEIDRDERQMISRIFTFSHLKARDVMIPIADVTAVPETATVREAAAMMAEHGFSRMPVFGERIDDVVGLLHHLDVLAADDGTRAVGELARPPQFVPEGQEIDDILVILQRQAATVAIVVDEFGGVIGLLTLEDILEEIVGDIDDEFDEGETAGLWRRSAEGWIVSARAPVDRLNEVFGLSIPESDEYETLAGYLLDHFKHIPGRGEGLALAEGVKLVVHRASERAIEEVLISGKVKGPRDAAPRA
jgi:CBS domain containing-hemolysin-like protein